MASIAVIDPGGGGSGIVERQVYSKDAAVIPKDEGLEDFVPEHVSSVEYDEEGQRDDITSTCGETESRRTGNNVPDITIEGIITDNTLPAAKELKRGSEVRLVSDIHQGFVYVNRLTVEQSEDLVHYIDDKGNKELAYNFQLQLGQEDSE